MSWDEKYNRDNYKSGELALTVDEVHRLLNAIDDNLQYKTMIALAISNGFRIHDLVCLERDNYDSVNRTITFYEKKKNRVRKVYVSSEYTANLLYRHISTTRYSKWMFPSYHEWESKNDPHVSSRTAYNIYNKYLQKAGIENPNGRNCRAFNSLRATCYKMCQYRGWTPRQACELIGDTLIVAETYYNKPSQNEMKLLSLNVDIITGLTPSSSEMQEVMNSKSVI